MRVFTRGGCGWGMYPYGLLPLHPSKNNPVLATMFGKYFWHFHILNVLIDPNRNL